MFSRIQVTRFAASYAVALGREVTRLLFRSGVRGAIMRGFSGAGLLAHAVFLYHRAFHATGTPLSSVQDLDLVAAWALAASYSLPDFLPFKNGFRPVRPAASAGAGSGGYFNWFPLC